MKKDVSENKDQVKTAEKNSKKSSYSKKKKGKKNILKKTKRISSRQINFQRLTGRAYRKS